MPWEAALSVGRGRVETEMEQEQEQEEKKVEIWNKRQNVTDSERMPVYYALLASVAAFLFIY